ncbi:NINE protein [Microbacterium sp. NPDC008134]|uniref:NINE protein n=1 Tax=Microbacterium sp. NPDC008134 TaxID=3364183 RepID=UPI0036DFD208
MTSPNTTPPVAGWHVNARGQQQWWDGSSWGPLAPQHSAPVSLKTRTAANLLWFFLGGFGAHRFYLRRFGTAWMFPVMTITQAIFLASGYPSTRAIGIGILAVLVLWLFIDLWRIPILVDNANGTPRPLY